jgi:transcriptional regulator with XRE-family HTH domain
MSVVKTIGKNIKKLMESSNISARRISEVIDVTHPTMLKYINGDQIIDSEKLYILAEYFNKDFDYFFSDEPKKMSFMFRADKPNINLEKHDCDFILDKMNQYIEIIEDRLDYIPHSYCISVSESKLSDADERMLEKIALEQRRLFGIENQTMF